MQPRIAELSEKKLVGKRIKMSFSDNKTFNLWRSFLPRLNEIKNKTGSEMYSVEIYSDGFFSKFNPEQQFEKWAAIEVNSFESVPNEMETITLQGGLYAVFLHKGPASSVPQTYQNILGIWLPQNSDFMLDDRPHFALMGNKYKNEDPNSEEELWIPIRNISNRS